MVGNEADDRLAGRAGGGTPTGGAGHGIFRPLATAPFPATVTDVWPGAGSNDRLAFSRGLFPSREQVLAAFRREGPDGWTVLGGAPGSCRGTPAWPITPRRTC